MTMNKDMDSVQNTVIYLGIVICLVGVANLALAYSGNAILFSVFELLTIPLLIAGMRYYRLNHILGFPIHGIPWSWGDGAVMTLLGLSIALSVAGAIIAIGGGSPIAVPWIHAGLAFAAIVAIVASNNPDTS